ncbi:MAG: hypothetical protein KDD50_12495 [Bdellovibrionales bacterium]|nr:hypothetical protein [Bdellovibrionales bacterium]
MTTREELLEKYKNDVMNRKKKKKRRNPFGSDLQKLRDSVGELENSTKDNGSSIDTSKEEFVQIVEHQPIAERKIIKSENEILEANKKFLEAASIEKKEKEFSQKDLVLKKVNSRNSDSLGIDKIVANILKFSLSEKDSTKRFLLYLMSDECVINSQSPALFDPKSIGMDNTSFNYAMLSLEKTGSFRKEKMPPSGNSGRPRNGYFFDKEKFIQFLLNY